MVKKRIKGGEEKLTKLEVIQEYPKIANALEEFAAERKAGGGKMRGSGWWSDFVDWLKRNKVLSVGSKIAAAIATATGNVGIGTALTAASKAAETLGYGKKGKGMYEDAQAVARAITGKKRGMGKRGFTANDMAQHVNPLAGPRGAIAGSGSYVQNHSSQAMRAIGSGTMPSHLQPFLTSSKIKGSGVSQAVGSIGNAGKLKF